MQRFVHLNHRKFTEPRNATGEPWAAMRSGAALGVEVLPGMRDMLDPWTFNKDGKTWRGAAFPELLRK